MQACIINGKCKNKNELSYLEYYGVLENGCNFIWRQSKPYLLLFTQSPSDTTQALAQKVVSDKFKNFNDQELHVLYFKNEADLKQALQIDPKLKDYEYEIESSRRFLLEKQISINLAFDSEPSSKQENLWVYENPKVSASKRTVPLKMLSFDIETGNQNQDLYSIGLYGEGVRCVLMRSERRATEDYIEYYPHEKDLLEAFSQKIAAINPQAFIGWNVINFDFNFLIKKYEAYKLPFKIGIDQSELISFQKANAKNLTIQIAGRFIIEGITALKTLDVKLKDYRLDTAAQVLLGEGKLIQNSGLDKVKEIEELFLNDKASLARYNLKDSKLVYDIFEQLEVLPFKLAYSELTGLYLEKQRSNQTLEHLYLPKLHRLGYIAPGEKASSSIAPQIFEDPRHNESGLFHRVILLHFDSFLPSIISTFKIDPLGKAQALLHEGDVIQSPRGISFHRSQHVLPALIKSYTLKLKQAKKQQDALQVKVLEKILSDLISAIQNPYSRFALSGLYESLLENAKFIMNESAKSIETWGFKVVYADLQGIFIQAPEDSPDLKNFAQELGHRLKAHWSKLLKEKYQADSELELNLVATFKQIFLFPQKPAAIDKLKQQYVAINEDEEASVSQAGLSFFEKQYAPLALDLKQAIIEQLFRQEDPSDYLDDFKAKLFRGDFDQKLIFKKRYRKPASEHQKNPPPHLIAANKIEGTKPFYVHYVIAKEGPEPVIENKPLPADIDYHYYLEKQVKPILEATLQNSPYDNLIEKITNQQNQLGFFN